MKKWLILPWLNLLKRWLGTLHTFFHFLTKLSSSHILIFLKNPSSSITPTRIKDPSCSSICRETSGGMVTSTKSQVLTSTSKVKKWSGPWVRKNKNPSKWATFPNVVNLLSKLPQICHESLLESYSYQEISSKILTIKIWYSQPLFRYTTIATTHGDFIGNMGGKILCFWWINYRQQGTVFCSLLPTYPHLIL